MTSQHLTKLRIETLERERIAAAENARKGTGEPPADAKPYPDGKVAGLSLIFHLSGVKTWSLFYRTLGHRPRRLKLGRYPTLSVDEARKIARDHLNAVSKGKDPRADREEAIAAKTVAEFADGFEADYLPTLREQTQADYKSILKRYIRPELGSKLLKEVTKADLRKLHLRVGQKIARKKGERIECGGHRRANMTLNLIRKMFNLAIEAEQCITNPAVGIERHPENARARYLATDEIARLMAVLDQRADPAVDAVKLLLYTGARRNEVLRSEWPHFDLDTGVWTKPMALVKTKRIHRVPLSGPAVAVLKSMKARADKAMDKSPYLFPGRKYGVQQSLSTAWRTIRKEAGIPDVRLHDLRHSFASILVNAGLSLPVIGSLLGHTETQTTMRYAHLFDSVTRDATEKAGAAINAAVADSAKKKIQEAA